MPSGGNITCYIDCVSPYSYFAFHHLIKTRKALNQHNITVEILPFFLGGARDANGNPFVPMPPVKAAWGQNDMKRVSKILLGYELRYPEKFPILSLFPIRVLTYIHRHHPSSTFESAFLALFKTMWEDSLDISSPPVVAKALSDLFPDSDSLIKGALTPENKKAVIEYTKQAQDTGAFGGPWLVVDNNAKREKECFWGSDRWDHVYEFLGIPYQPMAILEPEGKAKL